jgi:iron complex transport system ATP-binding protein
MLELKNAYFSYGANEILKNISLHISGGEFITIIGPNGSGKSTLLKVINGILKPKMDAIYLNNISLKKYTRKHLAQIIAYVPQETEFAFPYSVHEVVRMGRFPYLSALSFYSYEDEKIVFESLERLDILKFVNRNFNELSGGEKQRVVIASALAQQPKIVLLDEPTSALDLHHQISIYRILKELQKERNLTPIVVTHDINLVTQYCERMVLLNNGSILNEGSPKEVLRFQIIQDTFGVKVYIDINPMTGTLYILPYK